MLPHECPINFRIVTSYPQALAALTAKWTQQLYLPQRVVVRRELFNAQKTLSTSGIWLSAQQFYYSYFSISKIWSNSGANYQDTPKDRLRKERTTG